MIIFHLLIVAVLCCLGAIIKYKDGFWAEEYQRSSESCRLC